MIEKHIEEKTNLVVANKIKKLKNIVIYKEQFKLIEEISSIGLIGEQALFLLLIERLKEKKLHPNLMDGSLCQILHKTDYTQIKKAMNEHFKNGIIAFSNTLKIDYQPLQDLLLNEKFQEADQMTQKYLCRLAGINKNNKRNWLYFTDIASIPLEDLHIIDILWQLYSKGKFGFSVQRKIWLTNNRNWDTLWHKIGWKTNGITSRYPNEFIWNINAPYGHLPLFNQLRGVQVINALFNHLI